MSSSADAGGKQRDANESRPLIRELAGLKLDELLSGVQTRLAEISRTGDRLQSLLGAVLAVSGELELDVALRRIVRAALDLVHARACTLTVFDPDGGRPDTVTEVVDADGNELGELGQLGAPGHVPGQAREPGEVTVPAARDPESRTALAVPVRVRDEVFGTLYVHSRRTGGEFRADDEIVLRSLAAAAGVAIDNARLFEQSRVRERWLGAVATVNSELLTGASPGQSLRRIAEVARELSGADAAVVLLDEGDGVLAVGAVSGPVRDLEAGAMLAAGPVLTDVLRTVEPTLLDDLGDAATALPASLTRRFGPTVVSPLRSAEGVQGLLVAVRGKDAAPFTRHDLSLASSFAAQATLALQFADKQDSDRTITLLADRDRIAQDLHDRVIQRLFATGMGLHGVLRQVHDPYAAERIGDAVRRLDQTVREIRTSIFNLHSTGGAGTGLRRRLLDIVSTLPEGAPVPSVRIGGAVDTLVPEQVGHDVERVVREAVGRLAREAREFGSAPDIVLDVDVGTVLAVDLTVERTEGSKATAALPSAWADELSDLATAALGEVAVDKRDDLVRAVWTVPLPDPEGSAS
ncbi:histidine kinase [Saccharomonospora piscinae]|uniref:Histidine kinase n=1 Tax=Saccharomonospora piscinae TaxID=687388 RepID=A0A1V9A9Z9_SACPI|nr:GAF domain-containing protein [Saccharomonospora piscinae]OQO93923.1 histidine kinase [Saccharomonospora piscinae]